MNRARSVLVLLVLAIGFVSSYVAFAAYGGPTGIRIPYNGVLERDGVLVSGEVDFTFNVWNDAVGGGVCHVGDPMAVTVTSGRFSVVVGPVPSICVVNRDVYIEVTADDGSGDVTLGRQRVYPAMAAVSSGSGDFAVGGALAVVGAVTASSVVAGSVTATGEVTGDSVRSPFVELTDNNNGGIEIGSDDGFGTTTPFIDFHNGPVADYDARLILTSADRLALQGAELVPESGIRFGDNTLQTTAAKSLVCTYVESAFVTGSSTLEAYVTAPSGYTLTGGGCREEATGERQIMRSQPGGSNNWYCMSHDEDNLYTGSLKAYAFGCKLQ